MNEVRQDTRVNKPHKKRSMRSLWVMRHALTATVTLDVCFTEELSELYKVNINHRTKSSLPSPVFTVTAGAGCWSLEELIRRLRIPGSAEMSPGITLLNPKSPVTRRHFR